MRSSQTSQPFPGEDTNTSCYERSTTNCHKLQALNFPYTVTVSCRVRMLVLVLQENKYSTANKKSWCLTKAHRLPLDFLPRLARLFCSSISTRRSGKAPRQITNGKHP